MKAQNIENERAVERTASDNFSSDRLLIADPLKAERFARELLAEICSPVDLGTRALNIICHPLDEKFDDLSPAERMIFTDFIHQIGGRIGTIVEHKKELATEEIKTMPKN